METPIYSVCLVQAWFFELRSGIFWFPVWQKMWSQPLSRGPSKDTQNADFFRWTSPQRQKKDRPTASPSPDTSSLQATLLRKRSWSQAKYHPCIPEMTKGRIISKSPASWKANEPNLEDPNSSLAQKKTMESWSQDENSAGCYGSSSIHAGKSLAGSDQSPASVAPRDF